MKAARVYRFGPPEVITIEEMATPSPGDDEIVVRVAACGVGPWDAWVRAGKSAIEQPLPLTLGADLSGTVTQLGSRARGVSLGQSVFGVTNARFTGAYADFAVASAAMVAPKPEGLDHRAAAGLPVVAATARTDGRRRGARGPRRARARTRRRGQRGRARRTARHGPRRDGRRDGHAALDGLRALSRRGARRRRHRRGLHTRHRPGALRHRHGRRCHAAEPFRFARRAASPGHRSPPDRARVARTGSSPGRGDASGD